MTVSKATLAASFNAVAADYAATRPGYPAALYDAVEELAGRPLHGADVLDVGAGTGIGTAPMLARGAQVTAAEPGPGMAAQLRAQLPDVPVVRGSGDALPFTADSFDLVTCAQAWHWTDPARSVPEALRVLRPGGALALWWNVPDGSVDWIAAQERRLQRQWRQDDVTERAGTLIQDIAPSLSPHCRELRWSRTVPLDTHLASLATHSYIATLPADRAAALIEAERAALRDVFGDGPVTEPYVVRLTAVRTPA
ncbi:class I SAM-dependent methyltransferase [Streptomyces sp. NPDC059853]|uniref:class I SAM-dependent methyltransferase n=1 Tax=Streptomyces sp. NPDC059853 TaxID=3346973 RepID=UPI003656CF95